MLCQIILSCLISFQIFASSNAFGKPNSAKVGEKPNKAEGANPVSDSERTPSDALRTYLVADLPVGNLIVFMPAIGLNLGVGTELFGFEVGVYAMENWTNTTTGRFARAIVRFPVEGHFNPTLRLGVASEKVFVRSDKPIPKGSNESSFELLSSAPYARELGHLETTGVNFGFGQIIFYSPFVLGFDYFDVTIPLATRVKPKNRYTEKELRDSQPAYSVRIGSLVIGFYF